MPLELEDAECDAIGRITSGTLVGSSGSRYPIRNGIPRFVPDPRLQRSVESFGEEWNYFNFTDFRAEWLHHTVANTFGSTEAFKGQLIVDAGGVSGAQTLWMLKSGAKHVILLELSQAVDDVVQRNLGPSGYSNWDVIQCSIDNPLLRHTVIHHTPSVERTAHPLFTLVALGGQFVFNCYPKNDQGLLRWIRFHLIYRTLRGILRRCPFWVILGYA